MEQVKDTGNMVIDKVSGFLSDKPIWVWWLSYVALTALLFGISNLILYLLGLQVWIGILILIVFGLIWGSVKYYKLHGKIKVFEKKAQQKV